METKPKNKKRRRIVARKNLHLFLRKITTSYSTTKMSWFYALQRYKDDNIATIDTYLTTITLKKEQKVLIHPTSHFDVKL